PRAGEREADIEAGDSERRGRGLRVIAERAAEVLGEQPERRLREVLDAVDGLRPGGRGGEQSCEKHDFAEVHCVLRSRNSSTATSSRRNAAPGCVRRVPPRAGGGIGTVSPIIYASSRTGCM